MVEGYLTLSQYTDILGTWYKTGGIKINASSGIVIYGKDKALVTRASEFGTDQCYVGSDGKIYAGAGGGKKDSPRGSFVALRDETPSPLSHGEVIGGAKPEPPIPKNWRYFGVRLFGTGGT